MSDVIKGITCRSNLVGREAFIDHVSEVIKISADAVRKSFGPHGTHSFFNSGAGRMSSYTKDGVTILNQITFEGELENTIFRYLLESSLEINRSVGDGTTSAFLATERVFTRMKELLETDEMFKDIRPHHILMTINNIVRALKTKLIANAVNTREMSEKELSEVIFNIAKISLNNDEVRAANIAQAYSENGIDTDIVLEPSMDNETRIIYSDGRSLDYGYADAMYINDKTDNSYKAMDCKVLIFNGLPNNKEHENVLMGMITNFVTNNRPLTIICKDLSHRVKSWLFRYMTALNNQGTKNVINILSIPTDSQMAVGRITDLGLLTGAVPINVETSFLPGYEELSNEEYYAIPLDERVATATAKIETEMLGQADIVSYADKTVFRNALGEDTQYFNTRIEELQIEVDRLAKVADNSVAQRRDAVKTRLSLLNPSVVRLFVGGESDVAKRASIDLYDDAIKAVSSAIKNGYTTGGNMSVPIAIVDIIKDIKTDDQLGDMDKAVYEKLLTVISESFIDLYRYILINSGLDEKVAEQWIHACVSTRGKSMLDVVTYENSKWVVNPVQTDVTIAQTVLQLVTNLLTSNQYICSCVDNNYYTEEYYSAK